MLKRLLGIAIILFLLVACGPSDEDVALEHFQQGFDFSASGDYQNSIASYTKAIELKADYFDAYFNRGLLYGALKQYDRALNDYDKLIGLNPTDAEPYHLKGITYNALREFSKAVANFTLAIELNPKYFEAYYHRSLSYGALGEFSKQDKDYKTASELNITKTLELDLNTIVDSVIASNPTLNNLNQPKTQNTPTATPASNSYLAKEYYKQGIDFGASGDYQRSIASNTKAIELNPKYADAYYNRGVAYGELGQHDKSIDDFTKAIELNSDDAYAYHNRGYAYGELGQHDKALNDYNKAIELNPDFAKAYSNRGVAYVRSGQYDKALKDWDKVLEIDPNYPNAIHNIKLLLEEHPELEPKFTSKLTPKSTPTPTNIPTPTATPTPTPKSTVEKIIFSAQDPLDQKNYIFEIYSDGTGLQKLPNQVNPLIKHYLYPSWSPDGTKILFQSNSDLDAEIYVMNADGSGQMKLTDNYFYDQRPAWSPDGSKIVFVSQRDGDNKYWQHNQIYIMNADGSGQTELTNTQSTKWTPSWSPDGSKIAFGVSYHTGWSFSRGASGNSAIYIMNADGSDQMKLTDDEFWDNVPSWSPDGEYIAFQQTRIQGSQYRIRIIDLQGVYQAGDCLVSNIRIGNGVNPSWSPSDGTIAFIPWGGEKSIGLFDSGCVNHRYLSTSPYIPYKSKISWFPISSNNITRTPKLTPISTLTTTNIPILIATSTPTAEEGTFWIGSTKEEVLAAQGIPKTGFTTNNWKYCQYSNDCNVYFEDGKVSNYDNGSGVLNKLQPPIYNSTPTPLTNVTTTK